MRRNVSLRERNRVKEIINIFAFSSACLLVDTSNIVIGMIWCAAGVCKYKISYSRMKRP